MKKIRQNLTYHRLELSQIKERISKLREDETFCLSEVEYKKSHSYNFQSCNKLTKKIANQCYAYKSQLRENDEYRSKENIANLQRISELLKDNNYRKKVNKNNQRRMSQVRTDKDYRKIEREKDKDFNTSIRQNPLKRKIINDNTNSCHKKARIDPVSGPKLRHLEKEAKRKKRLNYLLSRRESYLKNTFKQSKNEFICDSCWNCVRKCNIPKLAATKNLSFIETPDYLKRLSPLGVRLVSPWLPFLKIVPLQQFTNHPQLSLKGNVVNIQVDVGEMIKCLPRRPENAQVIQIKIKRKMQYDRSYMAESIIVKDVRDSWKFLQNSKLYNIYVIKENEELFSQFSQEKFSSIVDENDRKYLLDPENELFKIFSDNDDSNDGNNECNGDLDFDDVLVIDQNREIAESTRIIAPGENKTPTSMYAIPHYEILCNPQIFGGDEPFDEAKTLTVNERHKLWLTHKDPRCRLDPTLVLQLGQMTVEKRTRDSLNFVTRRGLKNESVTDHDILKTDIVDKLINKDKAYKFLKPVVGSPAYSEDKRKFIYGSKALI
ncbi:unnamed protein product [Pieris macdunnoughi]|uniref:DUF6570 domain-containing protein n=1 Tax=Pieris macdunnoughi TaxID=345717 RepID=A0A821P0H8_9NEOP|nr:unnamed protein product [Pieris macdunnoughi]